MITDRSEVTGMIRAAKVKKNIKWAEVGSAIGQSVMPGKFLPYKTF